MEKSNKVLFKVCQTNNMTCRYEYRIHVTSTPNSKWLTIKIQYIWLSYDVAVIQGDNELV